MSCPQCGFEAAYNVKNLLSGQASCTNCGYSLSAVGKEMQQALDDWSAFVIAMTLYREIEKHSPYIRLDDADLTKIHCLDDLVRATEAKLGDIDKNDRRSYAEKVTKAAFCTAYPSVKSPELDTLLLDVLDKNRISLFG